MAQYCWSDQACSSRVLSQPRIAHTHPRATSARLKGSGPPEILAAQATADAILGALDEAAAALVEGALLVVSYGGQSRGTSGEAPDRLDETWVLFDRQLLADELYARWAKFTPGVRVVVLSDSCHSGSVVKAQLAAVGSIGPWKTY